MEKKSGFKPGDKIDFSPYLIGEELTFDQLKDMSGQFVVMCDECLPGRDPNGADDLIVVRVLNNATDSQGEPFIRLEDGDGKAYPYHLYPDEMVFPDEDVDEYTRVWKLIQHDDDDQDEEEAPAEPSDPLSIESGCFTSMRCDLNAMLQKTVASMLEKSSDEAAVTLKINIGLFRSSDGSGIIKPTITHKVTSAITSRETVDGYVSGDYALDFDEEQERYTMRELPPEGGQMTLI